jgi:outer membrane protein assembly factor BamB
VSFADLVHPNSIDIDVDGNYVVSMRDLAEIQKIDAATGETLWRFGGMHNEFTIQGDSLEFFSAQHSARVLPGGHLLVYDNGWRHSPPQTRVVEYALDLENRTATLVWEYRHHPSVFTPFMGSVQRLANGNTAVGFSMAGLVDEVDPQGSLVWEATLTSAGAPAVFYRALRIASLYEYQRP